MRSLMAVFAGVIIAVFLYQVGAVVAVVAISGIPLGSSAAAPGFDYFAANLAFAAAAAFTAGWRTARIARHRPLAHGVAVGVALCVLALWGFSKPASRWPAWYPPGLGAVALAGTLIGARVAGAAQRK